MPHDPIIGTVHYGEAYKSETLTVLDLQRQLAEAQAEIESMRVLITTMAAILDDACPYWPTTSVGKAIVKAVRDYEAKEKP